MQRKTSTWPIKHEVEDPRFSPATWMTLLTSTEQKTCEKCRHWVTLYLRLSTHRAGHRLNKDEVEQAKWGPKGELVALQPRPCQYGCCDLFVREVKSELTELRVYYHRPVSELPDDWEECWLCARLFLFKRSSEVLQIENASREALQTSHNGSILRYRIGEQLGKGGNGKVVLYGSIKPPKGAVLPMDRIVLIDTTTTEKKSLAIAPGTLAFRTESVTESGIQQGSANETSLETLVSRAKLDDASTNILSPSRLSVIQRWMRTCHEMHTACQAGFQATVSLPKRLLQIQPAGIRLVYTHPDLDGQSVDYATLSHCWGSAPFLKLTRDNHQDFCQGNIPEKDLELTFSQSIQLCRHLGLPYIWIDSFCIIQNSPSDWAEQAPQMGAVYANSTLNISAAASTGPSEGLFRPYDGKIVERLRFLSACGRDLLERSDGELASDHSRQPLYRRAWVAQEKWLAPRELSFCSKQMVWYCHKALLLERAPDKNIIHSQRHAVLRAPEEKNAMTLAQAWAGVVNSYSATAATFARDRVVALANLARVFESLYAAIDVPNRYLVGMWEQSLGAWLRWQPSTCAAAALTEPAIAPAWSWLSVQGRVRVTALTPSKPTVWQLKVVDFVPVPLDSAVPTGALRARLVVETRCFRMDVLRVEAAASQGEGEEGLFPVRFRCHASCWPSHECAAAARSREIEWMARVYQREDERSERRLLKSRSGSRIVLQPDRKGLLELGDASFVLVATDIFWEAQSESSEVRGIICELSATPGGDQKSGWRRVGIWDSNSLLPGDEFKTWTDALGQITLV